MSISFFLFIVIAYFISKVVRERGKKVEQNMYKKLGAMPTTIIMRFSDNHIDAISKRRYHEILRRHFKIDLPLVGEYETKDSDELYAAAMNQLRIWANNNRDIAPRVYTELKEYNFWRNLYGMKTSSLILYVFLIISELYRIFTIDRAAPTLGLVFSKQFCSVWILLISAILAFALVKKSTVQQRAFDYAKALIESCTQII